MFASAGMAKSRKDNWEAEQREKLAAQRIWPVWARTLGEKVGFPVIRDFAP
jgi:hypothetical protein